MKIPNLFSLVGTFGIVALMSTLPLAIAPKSEAKIIESTTESVNEANAPEASGAKGGSSCSDPQS